MKISVINSALLFLYSIYSAEGCIPGRETVEIPDITPFTYPPVAPVTQGPATGTGADGGDGAAGEGGGNPIEDKLGLSVQDDFQPIDDYDFMLDPEHRAKDADALRCNFESSCCWTNEKPPADQFEFLVGNKKPDRTKFEQYFSPTSAPNARYMLTAAQSEPPDREARFTSCGIECVEGNVIVQLKSVS